jgi:hypothetical protein
MSNRLSLRLVLTAVLGWVAATANGANQYWDTSAGAGMQHGNGSWSADAFWNVNTNGGGALGGWSSGNSAVFPASPTSGASAITLTASVSVASVTVSGGVYVISVSDGGKLLNGTGMSQVGLGSANNSMTLSGAGTLWDVGTNGARQSLHIGINSGATNNSLTIADGAAVMNVGALAVGTNGASDNRLVISNGVLYSQGVRIGRDSGSYRNKAVVTGPAALWNMGGGYAGVGYGNVPVRNQLEIRDGAIVTNVAYVFVGEPYSSYLLNPGLNLLLISGGGKLYTGAGAGGVNTIGSRSQSNSVQVIGGAGVTSLWNAGGGNILMNGTDGSSNNFAIIDGQGVDNSAVVTNVGSFTFGFANSTSTNRGGSLDVVNGGILSYSNILDLSINGTVNYLPGYALTVTNGGKILVSPYPGSPAAFRMGQGTTFLLRDPNSLMDGGGRPVYFGLGFGGSNIVATLDNGAVLTNATVQVGNWSSGTAGDNGDTLYVTNGARIYSVPGPINYIGNFGTVNSLAYLAGTATLWNARGSSLSIGYSATGNKLIIDEGATVTNAGSISLNWSASSTPNSGKFNLLSVTNGGRLYSAGLSYVGFPNACSSNTILVVGSGSLWNAGGFNLLVGLSAWSGAQTGHVLRIDNGGTVENMGAVSVYTNSNFAILNGGTLDATSLMISNGFAFAAGDGAQSASLKIRTGPSVFFNGLLVNTGATLQAAGMLRALPGIALATNSSFSAGVDGAGNLTLTGDLAWNAGVTCRCDVTNMNLGAGVGWDLATVSTLTMGGGAVVIKMNSLGSPAANFDSGKDYNLRILGYGSQTGYDPANFTVDTTDFVGGGAWTVTNAANALWLVYRGAAAPAEASYTWNAPNTGPWSEAGNWTNAAAPPAGGGESLALAFGDTGVKYTSTNNLAGAFQLNQLRLSSASVVTNVLAGNQIALTNTGARLDYLAGETGSFLVSNAVRLTADTEFGGGALATTLRLAGIVTNLGTLTKRGTWTLALGNTANNFAGPVVVDSPDGVLRLDAASTLNGAGNVTVSNGMLLAYGSHTFAPGYHNRRGLVAGSGSVWTNATANNSFTLSSGATNVQFTVDAGRLICANFNPFRLSRDCLLVITNGGYVLSGANAYFVADTSTNCQMYITGTNSAIYFNQTFGVSSGGRSNLLVVEKGGTIKGGNNFFLYAGGTLNGYIIRDGGIALPYGLKVLGSNNTGLVTGPGTTVTSLGNSYQSTIGSGTDYGNTLTVADQAVVNLFNLNMAMAGSYSNTLVVTNSGKVYANSGYDSFIASGSGNAYANKLIVSGSGSLWNLGNRTLMVCAGTGMLNQVIVEDGGLVTNLATLTLASGPASSNNNVTVNGGLLAATTLNFANPLPNGVTLTGSGQTTLLNLILTNAAHTFAFNGGTLNLRNTLATGGLPFIAGDGAQTAVLNLLPGVATNLFADGLVITNNATLTGAGLLQATGTIFGTLSPGAGIGIFTNNGAINLRPGANTRIELAAYTAPGAGWDCLAVTNGPIQLDGTLSVLLTGGFMPTNTQRFLIMTNQGPAGVSNTFANLQAGTIPAYTNLGGKAAGVFQVNIGPQGLVLDSFTLLRTNPGSLIMIR